MGIFKYIKYDRNCLKPNRTSVDKLIEIDKSDFPADISKN